MSMNISFNAVSSGEYSSINKNSAQYKAVERDHLSAIIANEATMSEKERLIYETFGGRDTIIKNCMKLYDFYHIPQGSITFCFCGLPELLQEGRVAGLKIGFSL